MRLKYIFGKFSIVLIMFSLISCMASLKTSINASITPPVSNHVYVNMASDPDLVALDIQKALEAEWLQIDLSTGEDEISQTIIGKKTLTTYKQVSAYQAPYELIISYSRGGYPYRIIWRTVLRDRANNKVIGTYKYDFNAAYQSLGWSNDKIIKEMINNLMALWRTGSVAQCVRSDLWYSEADRVYASSATSQR